MSFVWVLQGTTEHHARLVEPIEGKSNVMIKWVVGGWKESVLLVWAPRFFRSVIPIDPLLTSKQPSLVLYAMFSKTFTLFVLATMIHFLPESIILDFETDPS